MSQGPSRQEVESIARWMMEASLGRGALLADVLYHSGRSSRLSLRDGEPEWDTLGSSIRIGCRAADREGRQGVADTGDLSRDAIQRLVDLCLENCHASEPESDVALYGGKAPDTQMAGVFDAATAGMGHAEREERCRLMHALASRADDRVVSVREAAWSDGSGSTFTASSEGFLGWYDETWASCAVTVVLSDGEAQEMSGAYAESRRLPTSTLAPWRGRLSRGAPLRWEESRPPPVSTTWCWTPGCRFPCGSRGELFLAPEVFKNRSMLKGRVGQKVGSECLTLVDDGTIPWAAGTSPWDGEGVPPGRTVLLDQGTVASFLYDLKYAKKFGTSSTGNASRSPGSLPDVGFSNLFPIPGKRGKGQLLKDCAGGVFVTELMGVHTIDPISGDLSWGSRAR